MARWSSCAKAAPEEVNKRAPQKRRARWVGFMGLPIHFEMGHSCPRGLGEYQEAAGL